MSFHPLEIKAPAAGKRPQHNKTAHLLTKQTLWNIAMNYCLGKYFLSREIKPPERLSGKGRGRLKSLMSLHRVWFAKMLLQKSNIIFRYFRMLLIDMDI
ncbi:hypothetical protein [Neisseria sp.]|uniref:hypothetical protein n=1 Tax=Neisseria sp. TaxID=192066 RepID=UPI0026DCAC88|nr:hypothetical protein [Neisseria sp.]MDO4227544.1 hypothetical protein [Neisseria sp.]